MRLSPQFSAATAATCVAAALLPARSASADVLDLIGYSELAGRPGALKARGAGVDVAQVEVPPQGTSNYAPDRSLSWLSGKNFTFRTGTTGVSPHAGQVAALMYGNGSSAAPAVSNVQLFSADGFVTDLLRTGRGTRAPASANALVVNNSWVASFNALNTNTDAVRRLDDLINRDNVLVFNAAANVASEGMPKLLASSYNGITVGTMTGSHGPFVFDAPAPRIKPDFVVNTMLTSNATAVASGAGALLRSEAKARNMPAGQLAVKAILMAGAHRDETWQRGRSSGADNVVVPLDFEQGAGQLRVDNSFDILTAGRYTAGTQANPAAGWDSARTGRTKRSATYYLHVDQTLEDWAAVLTWNRVIAGRQENGTYSTKSSLADMDLTLYRSRRGGRRTVVKSDSPIDNVETLTLSELTPGDYQLVLTTDIRASYGLAWYAEGGEASGGPGPMLVPAARDAGGVMTASSLTGMTAGQVPEPAGLGLVVAAGLMLQRRRRRH